VFDINEFSTPAIDSIVHEKRKGGLGIRLVKSIMDKIEYQKSEGKTICRLVKSVHFK
jgi:serine/threonine-protein kinase RsbW